MQTQSEEIKRPPDAPPKTIALFLGLYLVVLAFFILLVTMSTIEESKSKKVMNSLSSAFTSIAPPSADLKSLTTKDGDVLAGQEFQQQITGIFATELGLAQIETMQPGRQMRLLMKSDSIFFQGEARIRPAMYPFLDRMVAALSNRPSGLRFDLEFVVGVDAGRDGKTMPTNETLELRRAVAFAEEMNSRGIPPDSVSVGMRPGHVGDVVMWFYTRDIETSKLKFTVDDGLQNSGSPANGSDQNRE